MQERRWRARIAEASMKRKWRWLRRSRRRRCREFKVIGRSEDLSRLLAEEVHLFSWGRSVWYESGLDFINWDSFCCFLLRQRCYVGDWSLRVTWHADIFHYVLIRSGAATSCLRLSHIFFFFASTQIESGQGELFRFFFRTSKNRSTDQGWSI